MAPSPISFGTVHRSPAYGGDLKDLAREVEALGYDDLWFNETILGRGPHLDALAGLAAAAGCTERLRLGTCVLLLPLHNPILVAKSVASIDLISGGRITLGVGVGGEFTQSFEALGVPVAERGARTNEAIAILRKLWTGDTVSHQGRFWAFSDVAILPPPAQHARIPIWIGGRPAKDGTASASMRRTATLGDGWVPLLVTPEMYRDGLAEIRRLAVAAGRTADAVAAAIVLMVTIAESRDEARRIAVAEHGRVYHRDLGAHIDRYDIFGTPQDCIRGIERYIEAGARHIIFQWRNTMADSRESIRIAGKKILPYFRGSASDA